jgi:hypothetical protein
MSRDRDNSPFRENGKTGKPENRKTGMRMEGKQKILTDLGIMFPQRKPAL